jgi:hypothetical protein
MVLNIVGLLHNNPIRIGVLIQKTPLILNGRSTIYPLSFVDVSINSMPLLILSISFFVSIRNIFGLITSVLENCL